LPRRAFFLGAALSAVRFFGAAAFDFFAADFRAPALLRAAFLPAVLLGVRTAFDARRTATFAVRRAVLTVRFTARTTAAGAAALVAATLVAA
jgi:hypothetical protein